MRILLGGIAGGILIFLWGYVDHVLLPFGRMGLSEVSDEAKWQMSVKGLINEPGLYSFPWKAAKLTEEQEKAWQEKWKAGPSGLLVLQPTGKEPMAMKTLGIELGSNILAALVASWVLSLVSVGYGARVAVVTLLGVLGWLAIDVSYWNWFGFPTRFMLAQLVDQAGGCLIAGLAMAAIIRPSMDGETI